MSEAHAKLPPSSAHVWEACTGWPTMMEQVTPQEGLEAQEGTRAHEAAAKVLSGENAEFESDEMAQAVGMYVTDVLDTAALHPEDSDLMVEWRVQVPLVHAECWGTTDVVLYCPPPVNKLIVWDFKYGHRVVEAFENRQLATYASGALSHFKASADCEVILRIVQPRAFAPGGPIREWKTDAGKIYRITNRLSQSAEAALGREPLTATGSHCRDCDAITVCQAALDAGMQLYEASSKPVAQELSPQSLGVQLKLVTRAIKQLEALRTGYMAQVEALIASGQNVPGWGIERSVGALAWTIPPEKVIALGEMFCAALGKPPAPITPTQAMKIIPVAVVKANSDRPIRGNKVVAMSDDYARQIFGDL